MRGCDRLFDVEGLEEPGMNWRRFTNLEDAIGVLVNAVRYLESEKQTADGWVTWHQIRETAAWPSTGVIDLPRAVREAKARGLIQCKGGNVGPAMVRLVEAMA